MRTRSWVLALGLAVFSGGCMSDTAVSKQEARERYERGDTEIDYCERYGWYGDGACDDWCPAPDRDCAQASCGGIAGIQCAAGHECVDDPSDECDPARGGADCAGLCVERESPPEICGGFAGLAGMLGLGGGAGGMPGGGAMPSPEEMAKLAEKGGLPNLPKNFPGNLPGGLPGLGNLPKGFPGGFPGKKK